MYLKVQVRQGFMSTIENDTEVEIDAYRLLMKTIILLDDCDRRFFAEYGLSARQFWALQHLDRQQGHSMVDLSRALLTDKSNVTGIVDRLERLHLVTRTPDPNDRRAILITLTEQGEQLANTVNEQHESRIRELLSVVSNSHLHSLVDYLHIISQNIEAYLNQLDSST